MQEASLALPDQIAAAHAALPGASERSGALLAPPLRRLVRLDGDAFFGFVTDRTLAALVELTEAR